MNINVLHFGICRAAVWSLVIAGDEDVSFI